MPLGVLLIVARGCRQRPPPLPLIVLTASSPGVFVTRRKPVTPSFLPETSRRSLHPFVRIDPFPSGPVLCSTRGSGLDLSLDQRLKVFETALSKSASYCGRLHSSHWFRGFHHNGRYVQQFCHQREQGGLPELRRLVLDMQLETSDLVSCWCFGNVGNHQGTLASVCRSHTASGGTNATRALMCPSSSSSVSVRNER